MENYGGTTNTTSRGGIVSWPPYHWIQQSAVEQPLSDFWEVKYDQGDLAKYQLFLRMMNMRQTGCNDAFIQRTLGMNNVGKYLSGTNKGFITHMRMERERLGTPREGCKWLPLRLKPRGTPDKTWIQVPSQIREFSDITSVLDQLTPTEDSFRMMGRFGYKSREELIADRANHLAFFLGAMAGDAGKGLRSESRFPSMKASVVLSEGKKNSEVFGEFTALAANVSLLTFTLFCNWFAPSSSSCWQHRDQTAASGP